MPSSSFLRLFIGLAVPAEVIAACQSLQATLCQVLDSDAQQARRSLRWCRPETLHLTLHFLGETSPDKLADLKTLVLNTAAAIPRLRLCLRQLDAFPAPEQARVLIWALAPDAQLSRLHQVLAKGLTQLGIPVDTRVFVPHLTLARSKQPRLLQPGHSEPLDFEALRLTLWKSELSPEGPGYTALAEADLGAGNV